MTGLALSLVLVAACFHASWNLLAKRAGGGAVFVWLFAVCSSLIYLPVAIGMLLLDKPPLGAVEGGFIALSAALHVTYFVLLQRGYGAGDLSVVYPTARATGPTLATLAAIAFFSERPSALALIGGGLIIGGVFFLVRAPSGSHVGRSRLMASLRFGIGAGSLTACYTISDAYAVSVLLMPPLILQYGSILGRAILLAPHAAANPGKVREVWTRSRREVLGVAVLNPLGYFLILSALQFTPVSYVAPAREVSVLIAVVMGTRLLGEGETRRRLGWGLLIVAGIILLALG